MYCVFQRFSASLCSIEAVTTTHHVCIQSIPLCSMTDGVLQLADIEFTVNMRDCFGNQFIRIEINSIGVLVIDGIPEFLELCFFKPSVQRIFQNLWLVGIRKHLLENACVINRLHQGVDAFFYRFQRIRNRSKRFCLCILPVFLRHVIFFVHIVVANQILINGSCLMVVHLDGSPIQFDRLSGKIFNGRFPRTVVQHSLGLLLQAVHNRQDIDILHFIA